jgi:formate dehydrogenase major subunit
MQSVEGVITLVQDGRFAVVTNGGRVMHFLLAHDASLEPQDLPLLSETSAAFGSTTPSRAASLLMWRTRFASQKAFRPKDRTMKLRRTIADRVAGFVRDWSVPRQFAGEDPTREAAQSTMSRQLRPRLEEADTIGTGICPYCAVGCAQLVYAKDGHVIHVEGDPRSPINQGALCPKRAATFGWLTSPDRLTKATNARATKTFVRDLPDGTPVNHTLAIGSLGGATLDNEENYLIKRLFGAGIGMVWIENQARV